MNSGYVHMVARALVTDTLHRAVLTRISPVWRNGVDCFAGRRNNINKTGTS
jgi:hypothetical protein